MDYNYNSNFSKSYTSGFYKNQNEYYNYTPKISFDIVETFKQLPIYMGDENNTDYAYIDVNWLSLSNYKGLKIFPNKFQPANFNQGNTGLCFLFSCLASIAGVPGLIYQLFGNNDNWMKTKKFIVYLFNNKKKKEFVISDKFPFDTNGNWIWSVPFENALFCKIIEKAYLIYKLTYRQNNKHFGEVDSLQQEIKKIIYDGGLEREAMKILINSNESKQIYNKNQMPNNYLNNTKFEIDRMFKEIKNYSESKKALVTLARNFKNGDTDNHAYSVIGAWEVGQGLNKKKVLCIKNPWDYGYNDQENFNLNSLNNSLKNFPDLVNFNKKYFDPKNTTCSYNQYDYVVGNKINEKRSSVFVAPLDYLIQNRLLRIEAHVPNYEVDFPSVKLDLDLYNKLDKLFKKVQANNVKNVFDSRADGYTISTRVLSVGDIKNEREIISNFHKQNFYTITKNGESYCQLERRQDGSYSIQNMSQIFKKDYMDNNFLLIHKKTGSFQAVTLDDLIGDDEEEKHFDGYDLVGFEHSIKPASFSNTYTYNFPLKEEINFEKNYYDNENENENKIDNYLIKESIKLRIFTNPIIKNLKPKIKPKLKPNKKEYKTINYNNGYYKGYVLNDKRHGSGRMNYYDGDYKDGNWYNDNFESGTVKITYTNKDSYIGEYSNCHRNGKGTYYYKDGDYLKGYFLNGKLEGYGEANYDGVIFKGNFTNGKRNGRFERISRSGSIDSEEYEYGEKKFKCIIF